MNNLAVFRNMSESTQKAGERGRERERKRARGSKRVSLTSRDLVDLLLEDRLVRSLFMIKFVCGISMERKIFLKWL